MDDDLDVKLSDDLSAYLDLLRFVAALAVLLSHMNLDGINMAWMPLAHFSHEAVVVFFVMSGFIIHSTTVNRHAVAADYVLARCSRIYSVALPAVVFSTLLSVVAAQCIDPERIGQLSNFRPWSLTDMASSLLFLNESWGNPASLSLNGPYWSLCYEVWYYAIFGAFFFGGRWRWPLASALCIVAGPAIMVLFPIWLAGAWLAARGGRIGGMRSGWWVFLGALLLIALINGFKLDQSIRIYLRDHIPGFWRLDGSQRLVTDYLIGAALTLHIHAFSGLPASFRQLFARHLGTFKRLAGFSFTLYLFHRPVTQLLGFYLADTEVAAWQAAGLACLIVAGCFLVSLLTERQLVRWRRNLGYLGGVLRPRFSRAEKG